MIEKGEDGQRVCQKGYKKAEYKGFCDNTFKRHEEGSFVGFVIDLGNASAPVRG
jgi:hypothetical protein